MNDEKFVVVEIPDGSLRIGVDESIETSPPFIEPVQEPEPIPGVTEVKYNKNMRIAFEVIFLISIYNLVIFSRIIDIINLVFIISSTIAIHSKKPVSIAPLLGHAMYLLTVSPSLGFMSRWRDLIYNAVCFITCIVSVLSIEKITSY
jgi:hypothetical protein